MTSTHKLIVLAIIWIVSGGILAVLYMNANLLHMEDTPIVVFSIFTLFATVLATCFITRSADLPKPKL